MRVDCDHLTDNAIRRDECQARAQSLETASVDEKALRGAIAATLHQLYGATQSQTLGWEVLQLPQHGILLLQQVDVARFDAQAVILGLQLIDAAQQILLQG